MEHLMAPNSRSMRPLFSCIILNLLILALSACGAFQSAPDMPYDMQMATRGYEELVLENYDQAEAFFDVARSVNPYNPYVLLNLGVVYQNTGRIEDARRMYRQVIELNPTQRVDKSTEVQHRGKSLADIAKINLANLEK
jgi:tetratricopeptide (TPR) repeat protein